MYNLPMIVFDRVKHEKKLDITYYRVSSLPFKVVQLSDLHNTDCKEIIEAVRLENPEVIVITGDIIGRNGYENSLELIRQLSSYQVLFVSGNHERRNNESKILQDLSDLGVIILNDKAININGIKFTGISNTRKEEHFADCNFNVLLVHEPENYHLYHNYDVILSGHAHGGQWRLFNRGVYAPNQGIFPKLTSGLHDNLIVSRGLGDVTKIPRINNRHEIIILEKAD